MILWGCTIPILWVRKLSTREFKHLTQDHTAKNRMSKILLESQFDFVVVHLKVVCLVGWLLVLPQVLWPSLASDSG